MIVCVVLLTALAPVARSQTSPVESWLADGDSFSAGEGIANASGACSQSRDAYGPKAARALGIDKVVFTACTGAITEDFYIKREGSWLQRLIPGNPKGSHYNWMKEQRAPQNDKFDVITMTYGGNDIGFGGVLMDCLALVPSWSDFLDPLDPGCDAKKDDLIATIHEQLKGGQEWDKGPEAGVLPFDGGLAEFYETVADRHLNSGGKLIVIGYPKLFGPVSEWTWWQQTCWSMLKPDATMLNEVTEYLDLVIQREVEAADDGRGRIVYKSVQDVFDGHGLCGRSEAWLNGIKPDFGELTNPSLRGEFSFHVNGPGHAAEAKLVEDEVRKIGRDTPGIIRDLGAPYGNPGGEGELECGDVAVSWGPTSIKLYGSGGRELFSREESFTGGYTGFSPRSCGDLDGDATEDVVLDYYWGGAHCCFTFWVVSTSGRVLLEASLGDAGALEPRQLDKDRAYELETSSYVFAYFQPDGYEFGSEDEGFLSFGDSPAIPMVFDLQGDRYVVATERFFDVVDDYIEDQFERAKVNGARRESRRSAALGIYGAYLILGRGDEGLRTIIDRLPDVEGWISDAAPKARRDFDAYYRDISPDDPRGDGSDG